jgi:hypothetical protein
VPPALIDERGQWDIKSLPARRAPKKKAVMVIGELSKCTMRLVRIHSVNRSGEA